MRKHSPILALVILATLAGLALGQDKWHSSYDTAHAEAKNTGRPLVIFFSTSNCVWCEKMQRGPLSDPGVKQLLARCVCVKLDGSHPVARAMNVRLFPTLIASKWDAKDGHMIEKARVTGYTDSRSLRVKIEGVK